MSKKKPVSKTSRSQVQRLKAENKQLRERVRELECECGRYREACRTWILSRYTPDDIRRIVDEDDDFQPLEQFVDDLEAIVRGKRKKGA